MEKTKISEAEWQVMSVVWSNGSVPASEVVEFLNQRKGWHSRTIRTLLDRLTRKKALKIVPKEKRNFYEALISMEQAVRQESRSFLDRVFGGEAGPMLLHLLGESKLSKEDIKQLKEMLSEKEK
jgi:BlaI family penicillinase repressor